jgi:hypothetical protein
MITNKKELKLTLSQYAEGYTFDLSLLINCVDFEDKILLDPNNNPFEQYEIFLACLLNLHLVLLQEDEFEMSELVVKAFYNQAAIMGEDVNNGEDEQTISWKYFSDEYFQETIQLQLTQYSKK